MYVSEILYLIYSLKYMYSAYGRDYLTVCQMKNKIRYLEIAKILDYNIPVI